jgi:hypothetical protein
MPTTDSKTHAFDLTPGRFVLLLLAVEVLLWLSERFGWLGWHKGHAVLTGVVVMGMGMLFMVGWFAVALIFRRRFQFSVRSLLVLVVVVALPCSWLAVEMKKARQQEAVLEPIRRATASHLVGYDWREPDIAYDCEFDDAGVRSLPPNVPEPVWLRNLLGNDFFYNVRRIYAGLSSLSDTDVMHLDVVPTLEYLETSRAITDAGLIHLRGLKNLKELDLNGSVVSDAGVAKLQQALPNCKITR